MRRPSSIVRMVGGPGEAEVEPSGMTRERLMWGDGFILSLQPAKGGRKGRPLTSLILADASQGLRVRPGRRQSTGIALQQLEFIGPDPKNG
jgi:hypothetical protein